MQIQSIGLTYIQKQTMGQYPVLRVGFSAQALPHPKTVLIIEDTPFYQQAFRKLMEANGFLVVGVVDNPTDGVTLFKSSQPALVLLDEDLRRKTKGSLLLDYLLKSGFASRRVISISSMSRRDLPAAYKQNGIAHFNKFALFDQDLEDNARVQAKLIAHLSIVAESRD